jgi:hypothetical protein
VRLQLFGKALLPCHGSYTQEELTTFVVSLFPSGLALHGKHYLFDECLIVRGLTPTAPQPFAQHVPIIELVAELVRRLSFPDHPSRFTSVFAWESLDDAKWFRQKYSSPEAPIFRMSGEMTFRGDINLLLLGGTILGAWLYATKYWRGDSSASPRWEVLVVPPVTIDDAHNET